MANYEPRASVRDASAAQPSSRSPLVRAGLVTMLLASAACSKSDGPSASTPVPLRDLCHALATADCDRLERCGLLAPPFDRAGCLRRQASVRCAFVAATLERAVAAGELAFAEDEAASCRDQIGALDCARGADVDYFAEPACLAMLSGKAAEGAACRPPISCASGLFCASDGLCPGRCQALGQSNSACSPNEPCAPGFFCQAPAQRCREQVGNGAPCGSSIAGNACVDGSFCDQSQPGGARCTFGRGRGNGCTSPYECASGLTCIANLCSGGLEHDTCTSTYECQGRRVCSNGRCLTPAGVGGPCDAASDCLQGLTCTSSAATCARALAPGASCADGHPCWLGYCLDGVCAAALEDGASCKSTDECLPNRRCKDGHCDLGGPTCGG